MNQDQRNILAKSIHETAMFFGKDNLTKENISTFIDLLIKFYPGKVFEDFKLAIKNYSVDPKNKLFFSPANLRPYIEPSLNDVDQAVSVASKALEAVAKFGWCNPDKAMAYIGDAGWVAVQRFGGWEYICTNLGTEISLTTFQAQIRDIAKTIIKTEKIENRSSDLKNISDVFSKIKLESKNKTQEESP